VTYELAPGVPLVRNLQPALRIALHVEPKGWPAAIAAIENTDERRWADHWLRQQAQIMRMRRATQTQQPKPITAGRVEHGQHARAQREQRRT
jgi:hypothetical protein